jgi:hypothetical protein
MRKLMRGRVLIAVLVTLGATTAFAQSDQGSVSGQFKSGAQSIGQGAASIGEGIKNGAIKTWDAVKAGAQAAGDKFNEPTSTPGTNSHVEPPPPPPPPPPPRSGDTP